MTKTLKLTQNYIQFTKKLHKPKPLFFHMVDSTTLDRSTIDIVDTAIPSYAEIKADVNNVTIFNQKIDSLGRFTRDNTSIHSTISVNLYEWTNKGSQVVVPDSIATDLIAKNIVEEVT